TPEERFKLYIEARARADGEECRNLEKSCPRLVYEMNVMAYEDRVRASEMMTTLACLDLAPRLIKLRILMAFSSGLAALRNTCVDEAHSAYLRGRRLGGRARRGAHSKDHPREVRGPDLGAQDDLGKITSHIEKEWAIFADQIGRVEQEMRVEVGVMWEAFSSFAREEMGLEPKTLIKAWFEPILPEIEAVEDTLDTTETNPQRLQEYASMLRQLWSMLAP
ncbi:MAG TPA: hypothetical protein VFQ10_11160, partial [Rubrobacter sp.]|nr:hypothetical protein [Rubrobacter sp.]